MAEKVVGRSIKNLSKEEMENIYGTNGNLIQPNSTFACAGSLISVVVISFVSLPNCK